MKRVRCPKCDHYIPFDETKYSAGQSLVFKCDECGKEFGIRIGVSKLRNTQKDENAELTSDSGQRSVAEAPCGSIVVIENVFHYKQVIPLRMGDNVIGRYQKGNPINTPIETVDPSVDLNHCVINVSRDKHGKLKYVLRDGNSNTGTFVDNVEILPPERRVITDGSLFTIGATSIILRAGEIDD
jgi:DNA-directed RNA polymerase subunit RPC12/RpoP